MKNKIYLIFAMTLLFAANIFAANTLKMVKSEEVCMVNDTHFGTLQIPVEVDGKTYYGCCANCKKTLTENVAVRFALDPVSGNKVDKATAFIGANAKRKVFYFETMENLHNFK